MRDHIDVVGASGTAYRFRRVETAASIPARAGNFVCVALKGAAIDILEVGELDDLSQAASAWSRATAQARAAQLYVRFNVATKARLAEHADITARHPPSPAKS